MGLFNLFEKKTCAICGGEIGLLGNRKLEDGNLCKNCAAKLSPWFSDRRSSTVEQIAEQLKYREENKAAVAAFRTARTLGERTKLLIDEEAGQFMVTGAKDLAAANPDVISFSKVTGVDLDVEEDEDEVKNKDKDGKSVSYDPPRYNYGYDFFVTIYVNHPYFSEIRFQLNDDQVGTTSAPVPANRRPDPKFNRRYAEYVDLGEEIKSLLTGKPREPKEEAPAPTAAPAAAPQAAKECPACGATAVPDKLGRCPYCGSQMG